MATITFPNYFTLSGMLRLDSSALRDLDRALDDCWKEFDQDRKRQIANAVKRRMREFDEKEPSADDTQRAEYRKRVKKQISDSFEFRRVERDAVAKCIDKKELKAETLGLLIVDDQLKGQTVESISVNLRNGECDLRLSIDRRVAWSFHLSVDPKDSEFAAKASSRICGWHQTVCQPKIVSIGYEVGSFLKFLAPFLYLWIGAGVVSSLATRPNRLGQEAIQLLEGGLDDSEVTKATELILMHEAGLRFESDTVVYPVNFWGFSAVYVAALLATYMLIALIPAPHIGIGKGAISIRRQEVSLQFVRRFAHWVFFAFVIGGLAIPAFRSWLFARLGVGL